VVLHLLDEREAIGGFPVLGDFEIHKNVLTHGVREEAIEILLGDFEVGGSVFAAVDDGGNGTAGADLFDRVASGFGAGTC
jgi:hypothetical protein